VLEVLASSRNLPFLLGQFNKVSLDNFSFINSKAVVHSSVYSKPFRFHLSKLLSEVRLNGKPFMNRLK
jgi:hypothetical protein